MKRLFDSISIKNMDIRNRIMMAPMCMYSADENGYAKDWHSLHYGTRAVGGVGLIMLEATAVEKRGRISSRDLGIWDDSHVKGLSKIVQNVKSHGAKIGVQLAHAGRKCVVKGEDIISASPVSFDTKDTDYHAPREMDESDIEDVISSFAKAAERAHAAGFDIIEIHAAHGYLINQFMSPVTNMRSDNYGGDMVRRSNFLYKIVRAVRKSWPDEKPICLRVSASDYDKCGNNPYDVAQMINIVKCEGIDIVNVSSGGVTPAPVQSYEGYQLKFAETIKAITELPVIAGGLIIQPSMADEAIRNKRADMIFLGRELLRNPYWPIQASEKLKSEIEYWPYQYERAKR
ncbi:NADPH2 dehydrogenase [Peptoclostridium litorale DSM 5388]|uniref:NADPH dehydrogenase NamA n=1 Tax=Peptoclostridium litorale DSM 5388 TaxID=1121324 RepID=A0A069RKW5_PEPLI|nr:NADPH dehydrogenase NamA [Peptoclostridium litorale]KDR96765.1 NADPH dehydrogenase NamA [Peptoclostridium litorale DSM 5388]SIO34659.1 NADPH2 dehydrogenase [Peptoclostridium litorale DSM 5388]